MTSPGLLRREVMKTAGAGLIGLAGVSLLGTASGHESYETAAEDRLSATLIPADSDYGFNYPYFLYAPKRTGDDSRPILVEPNNTGETTDDFETHLDSAAGLVENGNGRTLSEAVTVPLLVPVFPRPMTDPVDGDHYVHALDTETMAIDSGPLERVDLQLLRMVDHARELLSDISYPTDDEILLNGFSASGNFVNRFAALHPDRVRAVTAGAVNGTAILPIEEDNGHTLNYQIGIADLEDLTGEPFDLEAYREVDQFVFMGAEDENDTIPYGDAWSDEQREIALDVYGEDMQADRMPYCESVYEDVGASAEFRLYDGVAHRTTPEMMADLVAFHRRNAGITRLEFAEPPSRGDTALAATVTAPSSTETDANAFEIRAFDESNEELTESAVVLESDEFGDIHLGLTRELRADETVTAAVLEAGTTDLERSIVSARTAVIDTARVRFAERPTAGRTEVSLEYGIEGDYEVETPIHVYVVPPGERRSFLGTLEPGASGTESFDADTGRDGVPFEAGTTLEVFLRDLDRDEIIARTETVVADDDGVADPATVAFADHPTYDDETVRITYSVHEAYEVSEFVRLQLQTADNSPMLLERLEPGDSATESLRIDDYPFDAADEATVSVVDDGPLASDEATVLVREPDCDCTDECECGDDETDGGNETGSGVTPAFTYRPSDPSAGESITFDATTSSADGELLSYAWRFGDGTTAAGEAVSHAFDAAGEYDVRLDIVDDTGGTATVEKRVAVAPRSGSSGEPDDPPGGLVDWARPDGLVDWLFGGSFGR